MRFLALYTLAIAIFRSDCSVDCDLLKLKPNPSRGFEPKEIFLDNQIIKSCLSFRVTSWAPGAQFLVPNFLGLKEFHLATDFTLHPNPFFYR